MLDGRRRRGAAACLTALFKPETSSAEGGSSNFINLKK
jgi:hypothetical protein